MATIHRMVTTPRMVTNSTDQTQTLQLLFGKRTSYLAELAQEAIFVSLS